MELSNISFDDFFIDKTTDVARLQYLEQEHRNVAYKARSWLESRRPFAIQIGTGVNTMKIPSADPHYEIVKKIITHWAECQICIAHLYAERRASILVNNGISSQPA